MPIPDNLTKHGAIVLLKMHMASWAVEERERVLAEAGLFLSGCPFCGSSDICPRCYRCDTHHDSIFDMLGEREVTRLAVAEFFTRFCQGDTDGVIAAMQSIAEPEETIASYREPCELAEGQSGLDNDVWGSVFSNLFDDEG